MTANHQAQPHARERLAERYGLTLARRDWLRLAGTIDLHPFAVTDQQAGGTEIREAQVPIVLPDGTLVVPIIYSWKRVGSGHRNIIITVNPGGYWLRGRH